MRSETSCIGAGSSRIAAAEALLQVDFDDDMLEVARELGRGGRRARRQPRPSMSQKT